MKKASNENANRPLALWFTVIWWVFFVYMLAYILYLHKVHVACSYVMYFLFGLAIGSHITNNLQNKWGVSASLSRHPIYSRDSYLSEYNQIHPFYQGWICCLISILKIFPQRISGGCLQMSFFFAIFALGFRTPYFYYEAPAAMNARKGAVFKITRDAWLIREEGFPLNRY